jgi:hypothetical protein
LSMELYHSGVFGGSAVAKLSIFVSEYEFWHHSQIQMALFHNIKYEFQ